MLLPCCNETTHCPPFSTCMIPTVKHKFSYNPVFASLLLAPGAAVENCAQKADSCTEYNLCRVWARERALLIYEKPLQQQLIP